MGYAEKIQEIGQGYGRYKRDIYLEMIREYGDVIHELLPGAYADDYFTKKKSDVNTGYQPGNKSGANKLLKEQVNKFGSIHNIPMEKIQEIGDDLEKRMWIIL